MARGALGIFSAFQEEGFYANILRRKLMNRETNREITGSTAGNDLGGKTDPEAGMDYIFNQNALMLELYHMQEKIQPHPPELEKRRWKSNPLEGF